MRKLLLYIHNVILNLLCSRIDGQIRSRMVSTAAADADDTAILSVLHEREYRSSHLNGAVNVALNHVIDVFFRKFHEVLGDFVGNADVVDQQADASIRVHLLQRLLQRIVEA